MPDINLSKQHTQRAQLKIFTARFLFILIAGSKTVKMQNDLTKINSFRLIAKSIATTPL